MSTEYIKIPINEMNIEDLEEEHDKIIDVLSFLTKKDFSIYKPNSEITRIELEKHHTMYIAIIDTILNKDKQLKKNQDEINEIANKFISIKNHSLKSKSTNTCAIL